MELVAVTLGHTGALPEETSQSRGSEHDKQGWLEAPSCPVSKWVLHPELRGCGCLPTPQMRAQLHFYSFSAWLFRASSKKARWRQRMGSHLCPAVTTSSPGAHQGQKVNKSSSGKQQVNLYMPPDPFLNHRGSILYPRETFQNKF